MELNIKSLINIIKKSTVNHANDYCQLQFKDEKISWSLINQEQNIISRATLDNDVITDLNENIELNMAVPEANVIPYLQMFQNDIVNIKYTNLRSNIISVLKLKDDDVNVTINLSEPVVSRYFAKSPNNLKSAFKTEIDQEFKDSFDKIKKIAVRTNKIYFLSEDNKFYIESGDRSIPYLNSVKIEVTTPNDVNEKFLSQYIYKNIQSVFSILSNEKSYFLELLTNGKANISYIYSDDKSEEYYVMPQI